MLTASQNHHLYLHQILSQHTHTRTLTTHRTLYFCWSASVIASSHTSADVPSHKRYLDILFIPLINCHGQKMFLMGIWNLTRSSKPHKQLWPKTLVPMNCWLYLMWTFYFQIIHNSSTITSPISLHRFGNLQCLHLRRVPIHMVEGLQHLRCTLSSVTVFRSIDKLKVVFLSHFCFNYNCFINDSLKLVFQLTLNFKALIFLDFL